MNRLVSSATWSLWTHLYDDSCQRLQGTFGRREVAAKPRFRGNLNEVEVSVPATDIDRLCRLAVAALREQPSRVDIPKYDGCSSKFIALVDS